MNFDVTATRVMIKRFDGRCDVISLTGLPSTYQLPDGELTHPDSRMLRNTARVTPVVDGLLLKNIYLPWAMRKFYLDFRNWFQDKTFALYSGVLDQGFLRALAGVGIHPLLGDAYLIARLPIVMHQKTSLDRLMKNAWPLLKRRSLKKARLPDFSLSDTPKSMREFFNADVMVANESLLMLMNHEHLKGKTV